MAENNNSQQVCRVNSQEVVCTDLINEGVILNLRTKYYYTVNQVGLFIWNLIEQGKSRAEIIAAVTNEFAVDPTTAQQDLDDLMGQLQKEELIV